MFTLSLTGFHKEENDEGYVITEYPSFSDDNEFIPISALDDGTMYSTSKKRTLFFNLETITPDRMVVFRKYEQFTEALKSSPRWIRLRHPSSIGLDSVAEYAAMANSLIYFNGLGAKPEPLMVLCMRREFLFQANRNTPNLDHFCLVIDRRFIDDENHFKVYRNIKKYYIDEVEKSVDVVYTRKLLKLCYNDKIFAPQAKTVTELLEHYKSINSILTESIKADLL